MLYLYKLCFYKWLCLNDKIEQLRKILFKNLSLPVKVLDRSRQPKDVTALIGVGLYGLPGIFNQWDDVTRVLSQFKNVVVNEDSIREEIGILKDINSDISGVDFTIQFSWPVTRAILEYEVSVPLIYPCTYIAHCNMDSTAITLKQTIEIPIVAEVLYPRRIGFFIDADVSKLLAFEYFIVEVERLAVSNVYPILEPHVTLRRQPKKTLQYILAEVVKSLSGHDYITSFQVQVTIPDVYGIHDVVLVETA